MKLPIEVTLPEFKYHDQGARNLSSYLVEGAGLIFVYDWSTNELVEGGYRDKDKLILKEEYMQLFGRKMMRNYHYLQFGINKETHELTLRLV